MAKEFRLEEFVPLATIVGMFPAISTIALSNWCRSGKYPAAIKRSKFWLIHPEQFRQWWIDGGPQG